MREDLVFDRSVWKIRSDHPADWTENEEDKAYTQDIETLA